MPGEQANALDAIIKELDRKDVLERFRPRQFDRDAMVFLGQHSRFLDIRLDRYRQGTNFGADYKLAVQYRLTGYDAAYLELAIRKGLPLASLDEDLNKSALKAGVQLVEA